MRLTEASRSTAPSFFKLLTFSGMVHTLDFGSIEWDPDERSTALDAILSRFAIAPDGAAAMRDSEKGSLVDLYRPVFAILKALNSNSPVTEHLASPAETRPSEATPQTNDHA